MIRFRAGLAMLMMASGSFAAAQPTDFGIRTVSGGAYRPLTMSEPRVDVSSAASIASSWGRVTSTYRTAEHNRRVGGVRNSYHLRGRAIDIARRPGVRHAAIEAAYRRAGYILIESLDEGDHSHFAFGSSSSSVSSTMALNAPKAHTRWRIVTAAGGRAR